MPLERKTAAAGGPLGNCAQSLLLQHRPQLWRSKKYREAIRERECVPDCLCLREMRVCGLCVRRERERTPQLFDKERKNINAVAQ